MRVWKAIKPHITDAVHDMDVKKIVVIGYSHGAAIATTICFRRARLIVGIILPCIRRRSFEKTPPSIFI